MDLNYLYFRQQVSQFNADNAGRHDARDAHQVMADAYAVLIEDKRNGREPTTQLPSRAEAADGLREQAASCRKLALGSRTAGGSEALRIVAQQFDADAARVDPCLDSRDTDRPTAQAESLIRVREALERQTAQWLLRGPASEPRGAA